MQSKLFYYLAIFILATVLGITFYKYSQSKRNEKELLSLLEKSAYAIDRDNHAIHSDLSIILNSEQLADNRPHLPLKKRAFDSLVLALKTTDLFQLKATLVKSVKNKLDLNDSLIQFRSNWTSHGTFDHTYWMLEYFEHPPIYKYGDTINFKLNIVSTIGLIEPVYEIADFFPKQFAQNGKSYLKLSIPVKSITSPITQPFVHTIEYRYLLKNTYTNEVDTSYLTRAVTIIP